MTKFFLMAALVAGTAVFAAPETARADHCAPGYYNRGYSSYRGGFRYGPRSYNYGNYNIYSRRSFNSPYGYRPYGFNRGRSFYRRGGVGFGVRTRNFSFGYFR